MANLRKNKGVQSMISFILIRKISLFYFPY